MKAMIFAAGRGSRLKPITDSKPKALAEVNGTPLLGLLIERLKSFDVKKIIINVHHFPQMIKDYLSKNDNFGIRIEISDESDELLDTGGGLKKAAWFFDDNNPFIVHNSDVITDLNYKNMLDYHLRTGALATLAVRNRKTSRYLLFDEEKNLAGWKNFNPRITIIQRKSSNLMKLAFSGIHIINPQIFEFMPEKNKFGMIELYLNLCAQNTIKAYNHTRGIWFDVGTIEKLNAAEKYLTNC